MMNKLPPLKAIQTFEATARHLSFSRAANELCVSQSAVSHQIRALESFFDKKLLNRSKNQVSLTAEGDAFFIVIQDAFRRMQTASDLLLEKQNPQLKVVVQSALAVDWLAPRIARFNQYHPGVDVELTLAVSDRDFDVNQFDVQIGSWPAPAKFVSEKVRDELWYPVCTPEFYESLKEVTPDAVIANKLFSSEKEQDWQLWLQRYLPGSKKTPTFQYVSNTLLAAKAAHSSLGIALSCDYIVADAVQSGQLVALKSLGYELPWGHFYVHYRNDNLLKDEINQFVRWYLNLSRSVTVVSV